MSRLPNQLHNKRLANIAQEVFEVEHHLHGYERWFGTAAVPAGTTHLADRIGTATGPFQIDGGNDTWGAWTQILGSTDTPITTDMVKFDPHRIMVDDAEWASIPYYIQIVADDTAAADGLADGTYTEAVWFSGAAISTSGPIDVMFRRVAVGRMLWARCWAVGKNTGTLDFWLGIHEYEK
jgi:hypothetical protein